MASDNNYAQLSLAAVLALAADDTASVSVYLPGNDGGRPRLYREAGARVSLPDLETLRSNGVSHLCVHTNDLSECESALEDQLTSLLNDPALLPNEKARLVHQVGTSVARDFVTESNASEGLSRASSVVNNVIDSVLSDPVIAANMLYMAEHERTTASHMFVVSTLAIMLGAEVYGNDKEMLKTLGLAGMMHDIGKLSIDSEILSKPAALTPEELQLIQQHPIESVRLLGDDPHATQDVRKIILQHHEWFNGRGYPVGVSGADLLPGSRILGVVDSFHAMIGRRTYRSPMTAPEANRALRSQSGRQFDPEILACWNMLFERCWAQKDPDDIAEFGPQDEEVSARQEHRPMQGSRKIFGQRPKRFDCNGAISARCVYAGRLHDATEAPNEFVATLRDVSRSGICLFTSHPMYRGEVTHMEIDQKTHYIWVRGRVAWCRKYDDETYVTGMQFVHRIDETEADQPAAVYGLAPSLATPEQDAKGKPATPARKAANASRASAETSKKQAIATLRAAGQMRTVTVEAERNVVSLASFPDPEVRRQAIDVLASIGSMATRKALMTLLSDDDPTVREHAVAMAAVTEMGEATYLLRKLLDDPVESIALRAAGALGKLGQDDGLHLAMEQLEGDGSLSHLAAMVVGEIVGHRFPANSQGVKSAIRYMAARQSSILSG